MTTTSDIIRQAISAQLCGVHTCLPGAIVNYDYSLQKATIQPLLRKKYRNGEIQSLPELTNVPVIFPRSSAFSMSWPLNSGDSVLILFSERSLDQWLSNGGEVTPLDPRKFDLSDAICIPGLYPFSETSPVEDNDSFIISMGSAKLKISPSGTFCFHGVTEELMSIIDELFSTIEGITVAADQGGIPNPIIPINNIASFVALQARFNTLKGSC